MDIAWLTMNSDEAMLEKLLSRPGRAHAVTLPAPLGRSAASCFSRMRVSRLGFLASDRLIRVAPQRTTSVSRRA